MTNKKSIVLALLAAMFALSACQEAVDITNAHGDIDAAQSEAPLWRWLNQGDISVNENIKNDLTSGDFGHVYTVQATAGQTLGFHVEWRLPESRWLGSRLMLKNDAEQTLVDVANPNSNIARFVHTFQSDGTYRIFVGQYGYALFGRYPYVLSVFDHACATWQGTYEDSSDPELQGQFFAAVNLGLEDGMEPWAFDPAFDDSYDIAEHTLAMGRTCSALRSPDCGTDGPEGGLGYTEFPVGWGAVVPNVCEVKNHVFDMAGEQDNWLVWYEECSLFPEICEWLSTPESIEQ
jgi:hypothetical protein